MFVKLLVIFALLSLTGCLSSTGNKGEKTKKLGELNIKYYSNKTVSSLEIPPDLTKPDSEDAFRLSKYVTNIKEEIISFSDKDKAKKKPNIFKKPTNIEVKKSANRRWLVVDKKPEEVWNLSRNFLKSNGFAIKKTNKKIGLMETDFLENRPDVPSQSLGIIRAFLQRTLKARYALPIIDKYRVRIEPINGGAQSEVHLSLTSMEEVITDKGGDTENTIWQPRARDEELETEMLYRLMIYLGSDDASAKEKIISATIEKKVNVKIVKDITGYTKLVFSLNQYDTWSSVGWALDQLNVDIEDKDVKEGSFYVNVARDKDKGILSRLFGEDAIKKSFQIIVRAIDNKTTQVRFNDLSGENKPATIDFSNKFLANIAKQF